MSETKWMPGPWSIFRFPDGTAARENDGAHIIGAKEHDDPDPQARTRVAAVSMQAHAKRGQGWQTPDPVGEANANLIAAAPDLYAALEAGLAEYDDECGGLPVEGDHWSVKARAALAKARGESVA